jgi:YbbR domain-containing protein
MEKKTHVIIASLILSILVWLSVSMNNQYSVAIRVPFRVSGLGDNLALASPVPRNILVRARGTGWQLASSLISTSSAIDFDVSNLERKRILLTSRELAYSLDLGSSAEILNFYPDSVLIALDTIVTKKIPLMPRVDVLPREGFMTEGRPAVIPDSVTISGAQKLVEGISSWFTEPRRFRNIINSIDTKVALSDSLRGLVKLSATQAEVKIDIEQIADNTYKNIPVRVVNDNDSIQVMLLPPTVDITIRGGINKMSGITVDSLAAFVDFRDLSSSASPRIEPVVEAPPTFQVIAVHPDSVEFVIRSK